MKVPSSSYTRKKTLNDSGFFDNVVKEGFRIERAFDKYIHRSDLKEKNDEENEENI